VPQGRVGQAENSRPHRHSIPERPARSSVVIPTEPPGWGWFICEINKVVGLYNLEFN